MPGEKTKVPTWKELTERCPDLLGLLAEAASHHRDRSELFCANAVWYGYGNPAKDFKARLLRLVGWEALTENRLLRTSAAYDVAYSTIYNALPDCRGGCMCL